MLSASLRPTMTSSARVPRLRLRGRRGLLGVGPGLLARVRRDPPSERVSLTVLALLSVLLLVSGHRLGVQWAPPASQVLPLLGGGLLLGRRSVRLLIAVVAACLAFEMWDREIDDVRPGTLVVVGVTAVVAHEFARIREETGLGGLSGGSVLVELRRRLEQQGRLPPLPGGWHAEAVVRPAGGGPFAGDFVVSARTGDGRRLEVALVDVSGKGVAAGTRALLLSGALGGLLGSKAPEDLLPAANSYLDRQEWEEGFATAVHLVADLVTGEYAIASAGHPPVAHFDAGSGRWSLAEAHGPALGLLPETTYEAARGRLDPGDALILYTDGLVEIPGRDLSVGIDKLLGEAERLVPRGFTGGADVLVTRVAEGSSDDRGLVLIWRTH